MLQCILASGLASGLVTTQVGALLQVADAQETAGKDDAAAHSENQQVPDGRDAPEATAAEPAEAAPAKEAPARSPAGPPAGKRSTQQPTSAAAQQRPAAAPLPGPAAFQAAVKFPQARPTASSVPSSGRSSCGVQRQAPTGSRHQAFVFSSTDLESCLRAPTHGTASNRQVDSSEQQPSQPSVPGTEVLH